MIFRNKNYPYSKVIDLERLKIYKYAILVSVCNFIWCTSTLERIRNSFSLILYRGVVVLPHEQKYRVNKTTWVVICSFNLIFYFNKLFLVVKKKHYTTTFRGNNMNFGLALLFTSSVFLYMHLGWLWCLLPSGFQSNASLQILPITFIIEWPAICFIHYLNINGLMSVISIFKG